MKIAYFDCFAGISGDMILASLIDAGLKIDILQNELEKLNINKFTLDTIKVMKNGISGSKLLISVEDCKKHRHLKDITDIIQNSTIEEEIKTKAMLIFNKLAEVEAKIHNTTIEEIHFHEVGAMDAIIDIVGALIGLKQLGIEKVYASHVHVGKGFVHCQHGKIPVPAPATLELLKQIPIYSTGIESELTTPTGAAILSTICNNFGSPPPLRIQTIGYGAGTNELDIPNLLRVQIGDYATSYNNMYINDEIILLETNVDDISPEILGYIMERLLEEGALDVYFTSIQMKKNRPGTKISILTKDDNLDRILKICFQESSTLGVRFCRMQRKTLHREEISIKTEYGSISTKAAFLDGKLITASPEFGECKKIAKSRNIPLKNVYHAVSENISNAKLNLHKEK